MGFPPFPLSTGVPADTSVEFFCSYFSPRPFDPFSPRKEYAPPLPVVTIIRFFLRVGKVISSGVLPLMFSPGHSPHLGQRHIPALFFSCIWLLLF